MKQYRTSRYRSQKKEPIPLDGSRSITSLRPCSDDPARINIVVGRRYVGRVLIETKTKHQLEVGLAWTQPLHDLLSEEINRGNAYRAGVRILTKRAKSSFELERRLREYGYETEAINWAVNRLSELQVLDDEQYARMVVRNQLSRKPAGRRFLVGKLREKGIAPVTIDAVLDEMLEERDSHDDALDLAQKAYRSLSSNLEPEVVQRRITGRLARRGFDFDVIRKVLEEIDITR